MCENLNAEIAIGTISSLSEAVGYLTWTYFARRVKMNPSFYGAVSTSEEDIDSFLDSVAEDALVKLKEHGCISPKKHNTTLEDDSPIIATVLGQAAANFYLQYRTPKQMLLGTNDVRKVLLQQLGAWEEQKETKEGNRTPAKSEVAGSFSFPSEVEVGAIAQMLYVLAHTHEFDELPVRHNEEYMNAELSESLPWGPDTQAAMMVGKGGKKRSSEEEIDIMADPHTK